MSVTNVTDLLKKTFGTFLLSQNMSHASGFWTEFIPSPTAENIISYFQSEFEFMENKDLDHMEVDISIESGNAELRALSIMDDLNAKQSDDLIHPTHPADCILHINLRKDNQANEVSWTNFIIDCSPSNANGIIKFFLEMSRQAANRPNTEIDIEGMYILKTGPSRAP